MSAHVIFYSICFSLFNHISAVLNDAMTKRDWGAIAPCTTRCGHLGAAPRHREGATLRVLAALLRTL